MRHTLELTTAECIMLVGLANTLRNETENQAVERISAKIRERVLFDLKKAETERNWKEMDDDL